MHKVL